VFPDFTPEKRPDGYKADAMVWLLRGAVVLGGGAIVLLLTAFLSLQH